jgi:hypothetical protein
LGSLGKPQRNQNGDCLLKVPGIKELKRRVFAQGIYHQNQHVQLKLQWGVELSPPQHQKDQFRATESRDNGGDLVLGSGRSK